MPEETAIASVQFKEKSKTPVILKTKTNLPKPKQTTFSGERGAHKFFEYWKSFNEEQQGCAEAKVYRKELSQEMDPADVAEAQRQARQWLAEG